MALTSGFRRLFGMSVPDCLQEVRMERASELLRDGTQSIAQTAGAVGYEHSCIFSTTVIRALFGHSPQKIRVIRCQELTFSNIFLLLSNADSSHCQYLLLTGLGQPR
jgi:AraC-like DNA-binding protein